ncbi:hypothetical protein HDU97_005902 [Phlyctochytrium planicorne]|nr:hypothetical protein HDU97_005902 [Phlyctochytrium planicorne]
MPKPFPSSKPFHGPATTIVKKYLNHFVKLVHPDLFRASSDPIPQSTNQSSLSSLNSLLGASFPKQAEASGSAAPRLNDLPQEPMLLEFYRRNKDGELERIRHRIEVWPTEESAKRADGKVDGKEGEDWRTVKTVLSNSLLPHRLVEVRRSAIASSFLDMCAAGGIEVSKEDFEVVRRPAEEISRALKARGSVVRKQEGRVEKRSMFSSKEFDALVRGSVASGAGLWRDVGREKRMEVGRTVQGELLEEVGKLNKAVLGERVGSQWVSFHDGVGMERRVDVLRRLVKAVERGVKVKEVLGEGTVPVFVGFGFSRKVKGCLMVPWDFGVDDLEAFVAVHGEEILKEVKER